MSDSNPQSATRELESGDTAPAFTAIATGGEYGDGAEVSLSDFAGKTVVLYFYPKDDTPGCTTQACSLRDSWARFTGKATVFGVSVDPVESHKKFIAKYSLPFPLLSDPDQKIVNDYGVWGEKTNYGKTYFGTERSTFVIGADGKLIAVFRKVKPEGHVDQVLSVL